VNPKKIDSIVVHGNKNPRNGMYKLKVCLAYLNRNENKAVKEAKLWHKRMGHVNFKSLHQLNTNKVVIGVPTQSTLDGTCVGCMVEKQSKEKFPPKVSHWAEVVFELVYMDICGPLFVSLMLGSMYFITFIDDYNRWTWTYFMKAKSKVFNIFKRFKQEMR
jgi:hypothetical protein